MNDIGADAFGDVRPDNPSPEMTPSRSALLIFNPRAGSLTPNGSLERVVRAAGELGWRIEVAETAAAGDATRLAASSSHPVVLCAGGDGTLNEVIQGLAGTDITVGAIPLGTVNVWARELGLSLDPVEATRQLLTGHVRRIDLGRANGRYFLLMAGLGIDAVAIHAIEGTTTKRRFGPLAFLAAGAFEALSNRGHRLRLQVDDGETFETNAALVTVGNTRLWAGAVQITNRASAVDGLLDVCVFPGRSLLTKLRHLFLVFIGRHASDPEVTYLQVRRLQVAARPPVPIQVDGEPLGLTPALIEVVPASLSVLVGSGLAPAVADALDVPNLLSN
jgi:YegS/Rv2252/BmrU family lipid kinase